MDSNVAFCLHSMHSSGEHNYVNLWKMNVSLSGGVAISRYDQCILIKPTKTPIYFHMCMRYFLIIVLITFDPPEFLAFNRVRHRVRSLLCKIFSYIFSIAICVMYIWMSLVLLKLTNNGLMAINRSLECYNDANTWPIQSCTC